ncbi:MAG: TIGR03936 family radical SAM-associated protein [Ilumatobacter sp.]|uniref:TIGR03936 family radical SAM-associated protein n=1 Tax=Ilumatobacter sp. TaxID=1967498 RepID=UPI002634620C|nr:TIGR03936 family radical SAM-associated protein [Ilumatobacter sp.]MDJ0771276.1 TIGR03936 family radical SAM-associated protein [Ilumatobacter sp.]
MKLRVRSSKLGKVRFTSHRDAARMWERALRRAGLPVAATEGFTPRPKMSFGLALPTGAESIAEYVDIELQRDVVADDVDLNTLPARLGSALPIGFDVLVVAEREQRIESLQESVTSCTWELWSPRLTAEDHADARRLLEAPELVLERERKGKRSADDVRPMILDIRPDPAGDRAVVDLATVGRALRPGEFAELAYPRVDARDVRALRTHQWLDRDGERREVLPLPADVDARALAVLA